jgi:hypothetical protein
MITVREFERLYAYLDQERLSILIEIHNIILECAQYAAHDPVRGGSVYYDAARGGHVSAGICLTKIMPDHIRLGFIHGAFLSDPCRLLEGKTFPKRYVRIHSYDAANWDAIKQLIREHSLLDLRSLSIPPHSSE